MDPPHSSKEWLGTNPGWGSTEGSQDAEEGVPEHPREQGTQPQAAPGEAQPGHQVEFLPGRAVRDWNCPAGLESQALEMSQNTWHSEKGAKCRHRRLLCHLFPRAGSPGEVQVMEVMAKKSSVGWKTKNQLSWGHWKYLWCPQLGWEHSEESLEQPQSTESVRDRSYSRESSNLTKMQREEQHGGVLLRRSRVRAQLSTAGAPSGFLKLTGEGHKESKLCQIHEPAQPLVLAPEPNSPGDAVPALHICISPSRPLDRLC